MRNFECSNCNSKIFFASTSCPGCEFKTAFDPDILAFVTLQPGEESSIYQVMQPGGNGQMRRICANATHEACDWLAQEGSAEGLCIACGLNDVIPNLTEPENIQAWQELERAKKRLIYSLLRAHPESS